MRIQFEWVLIGDSILLQLETASKIEIVGTVIDFSREDKIWFSKNYCDDQFARVQFNRFKIYLIKQRGANE